MESMGRRVWSAVGTNAIGSDPCLYAQKTTKDLASMIDYSFSHRTHNMAARGTAKLAVVASSAAWLSSDRFTGWWYSRSQDSRQVVAAKFHLHALLTSAEYAGRCAPHLPEANPRAYIIGSSAVATLLGDNNMDCGDIDVLMVWLQPGEVVAIGDKTPEPLLDSTAVALMNHLELQLASNPDTANLKFKGLRIRRAKDTVDVATWTADPLTLQAAKKRKTASTHGCGCLLDSVTEDFHDSISHVLELVATGTDAGAVPLTVQFVLCVRRPTSRGARWMSACTDAEIDVVAMEAPMDMTDTKVAIRATGAHLTIFTPSEMASSLLCNRQFVVCPGYGQRFCSKRTAKYMDKGFGFRVQSKPIYTGAGHRRTFDVPVITPYQLH